MNHSEIIWNYEIGVLFTNSLIFNLSGGFSTVMGVPPVYSSFYRLGFSLRPSISGPIVLATPSAIGRLGCLDHDGCATGRPPGAALLGLCDSSGRARPRVQRRLESPLGFRPIGWCHPGVTALSWFQSVEDCKRKGFMGVFGAYTYMTLYG